MKLEKQYNFDKVEPQTRKLWDDLGIYKYNPASKAPCFTVDTPPPYVSSAHLHVGHAMSYSQAEFVVRYKRMQGYNVFYPMGFDDNGLPTERFVEKKYKVNKGKIKRSDFIKLCLDETQIGAKTYEELWKALGISVDWSLSYSTIDHRSRKTAQKSFIELVRDGLIVQKKDPIIWCYTCNTSLSQTDIEYQERDTFLFDIKFSAESGQELIISTTRPELLAACVALYVNPEDTRFLDLVGKNAIIPIFNRKVPIRTHKDVDISFGTGLMMVCTWGDLEDVVKWREDQLETILIFDENGNLNEKAGQFAGLKPPQARKAIVEVLEANGLLVSKKAILHNVGVHDRCENAVEISDTKQWFIRVLDFKDEFMQRGEELNWYPKSMKVRYDDWVKGLKWDWCISRQRFYGVPFPVWYCKNCNKTLFASSEQLPVDPLIDAPPQGTVCECGGTEFTGEGDVMDTWMTSSCTPLINAHWAFNENNQMDKLYPNALRVQAFEIIRSWLFYTIVKSHFHTNSLPWKDVMISGWGLDEHGKKMSKRLGNFVDPQIVIKKYSADALRYWSASSTLGQNLRYTEGDVAQGKKLLTKLWNSAKFISTYMFDDKNNSVPITEGENSLADNWIRSVFMQCVKSTTDNFDKYEYSHVLIAVEQFFLHAFCDNYLEIVKLRLWKRELFSVDSSNAAFHTLVTVFSGIIKLFAPFIPYITEEIFQNLLKPYEQSASVHISKWPEYDATWINKDTEQRGELLLEIISHIRKLKTFNAVHSNFPLKQVTILQLDDFENLKSIEFDLKNAVHAENITISSYTQGTNTDEANAVVLAGLKSKIYITVELEEKK